MDSHTHELHNLLMELIRLTGMLQLDRAIPGQPISVSQVFALHELDTSTPLSQQELAARLGLDKSTVSRLVADLVRQGLVARERDPANRRLYRLQATAAGRALHRRLGTAFHDYYQHWVAAMTPEERAALLTGLPALVRAVREHPVPWIAPPRADGRAG